MKLIDGWYAILDTKELNPKKPIGIERFGMQLLAWKSSDGQIVVSEAWCPHRGANLSLGKIKGSCIVCPYHGFEFNNHGACEFIPETGDSANNLKIKVFPALEEYGFIWIWWGKTTPSFSIPWFKGLNENFSYGQFTETWPVHYSRAIENQLDSSHLPFVHQDTIGASVNPQARKTFLLEETFIKVPFTQGDQTSENAGFLELIFPNIWQLAISEKFKIIMAFVPINEASTKLYLRSYQCFMTLPIIGDLLNWIIVINNRRILQQDREIVISQKSLSKDLISSWSEEKLFPSDQAIAFYRKKLQSGSCSISKPN